MPSKKPIICCPACQSAATEQRAENDDGATLFLGVFDEEAGMGMDVEDDAIRKFQCSACPQVFFLPS